MEAGGVIFFDITQLILRVAFASPSGIGRVELAYVRHLLTRYPGKVKFIFALPRLVQIVPEGVVDKYVKTLEVIWREDDLNSASEAQRLDGLLGTQGDLARQVESGGLSLGNSRRARRARLVAEFLLNVTLNLGTPRNLGRYSNTVATNYYISVSNSIITSKWIAKWLARSPSVKSIFLLHDIIPITNPEFTLPNTTKRHASYVKRLASAAGTIIANSKYTEDSLVEYANSQGFSLPAVVSSQLGVEDIFVDNRGRNWTDKIDCPYFVFVATIEPRKNHILILQVWQRLVSKLGAASPKLLLVGRRGWENENVLDLIERSATLAGHVVECGGVPDRLLVRLLAGARAALFPSHVEGYGLPLAEALSVGTPVICSDIPPFREIAGDVPEYVDPLAGRGWIKLVADYAQPDSERRAQQVERMRSYTPHRWCDHFTALDDLLVAGDQGLAEPPLARLRAAE